MLRGREREPAPYGHCRRVKFFFFFFHTVLRVRSRNYFERKCGKEQGYTPKTRRKKNTTTPQSILGFVNYGI